MLLFRGHNSIESGGQRLAEDNVDKLLKKKLWGEPSVYSVSNSKSPFLLPNLSMVQGVSKRKRIREMNNKKKEKHIISTEKEVDIGEFKNEILGTHLKYKEDGGKGLFHIPTMKEFKEGIIESEEISETKGLGINTISSIQKAYHSKGKRHISGRRSLSPLATKRPTTTSSIILRTQSTLTLKEISMLEDWATLGNNKLNSADINTKGLSSAKGMENASLVQQIVHTQNIRPKTVGKLESRNDEFESRIESSNILMKQARNQEKTLAFQVDSRVKEIRDWLPKNFMFQMQMHKYIYEKGAEVINKIFTRLVNSKIRAAILSWKEYTLTLREIEAKERLQHFQMVHSLERLNFIMKRLLHGPLHLAMQKWLSFVNKLKSIRRIIAARSIQRVFRDHYRYRKYKFQRLTHSFGILYSISQNRHRKATIIQCAWRCHVARKVISIKRYHKHLYDSAVKIQARYRGWNQRNTVIKNIRIEKQEEARLEIERLHKIQVELQHRAEILMIFESQKSANNNLSALKIQATWRGYLSRKKSKEWKEEIQRASLALSALLIKEAEDNFAALIIQGAWKKYLDSVSASTAVDVFMQSLEASLKETAALRIQYFFRKIHYNKTFNQLVSQLDKLIETSATKIQNTCRRYLAVNELVYRRTRFLASRKIQSLWRGKLARNHFEKYKRDAKHLISLLEKVWPGGRKRIIRKRVLRRWNRDKFTTMKYALKGWKLFVLECKEEKELKAAKEMTRKANNLFRRQMFRRVWKGLLENIRMEKYDRDKLGRAIRYWQNCSLKKTFITWVQNSSEYIYYRKRLVEIFLFLSPTDFWNSSRMQAMADKAFYLWRTKLLALIWKELLEEKKYQKQLQVVAVNNYNEIIKRKRILLFECWKMYLKRQLRNKMAIKRGHLIVFRKRIDIWCMFTERKLKMKRLMRLAWGHNSKSLKSKVFNEWRSYHNYNNEIRRKVMETWRASAIKSAIKTWERKVYLRMYRRAVALRAMNFMKNALLSSIFYAWENEATGGKLQRRYNASIKIQKNWRGKLGRQFVKNKRFKIKYAEDQIIKSEKFVLKIENDRDLLQCKNSSEWLLVRLFAPWCFNCENCSADRVVLSKLGYYLSKKYTNIKVARSSFGQIDIPDSWGIKTLPAVLLYWNGGTVNHGLSWKRICTYPYISDPLNEKQLLDWLLSRNEEATRVIERNVTKLQAVWKSKKQKRIFKKKLLDKHLQESEKARQDLLIAEAKELADSIQRKKDIDNSWVQYEDPKTGVIGWRNQMTNEIRWTPPEIIKEREALEASKWKDPTIESFPWAILCDECETEVAKVVCGPCDKPYCIACLAQTHSVGNTAKHYTQMIDLEAMNSPDGSLIICQSCDVQKAITKCKECEEDFCVACFQHQHSSGKKAAHEYESIIQQNKVTTGGSSKISSSAFLNLFRKSVEVGKNADILPCCVSIAERRGWVSYKKAADKAEEDKRKADQRKAKIEANRPLVKAAFEMFDLDGSGYLSTDEVKLLLHDNLCEPVTDKEIKDAMNTMDKDGNGEISFEEFLDWFSNDTMRSKEDGSNLRLSAIRFKLRTSKTLKDLQTKLMPEKTTVPNFWPPTFLITKHDFYNRQEAFIRYVSTTYGIDVQDDMPEDRAIIAFEEKFMPVFNEGKLDETYYLDGYDFKYNSIYYTQAWNHELNMFHYRNHETNDWQLPHPQHLETLKPELLKAFLRFPQHSGGTIQSKHLSKLLLDILCEPFTDEEIEKSMKSLSIDGKISFESFINWYVSEIYKQERKKNKILPQQRFMLNQKRLIRETKEASLSMMKKLLPDETKEMFKDKANEFKEKMADSMLKFGASKELIELIDEGWAKPLAQKSLLVTGNNLDLARKWLIQEKKNIEKEEELMAKRGMERRKTTILTKAFRSVAAVTKTKPKETALEKMKRRLEKYNSSNLDDLDESDDEELFDY